MVKTQRTPPTQDEVIRKAIAALVTRSERAEDVAHLIATFVDCGIIDMIDNPKNQILYGRRGTGKTHVLRYLESLFRERGHVVVYIDSRTLGSSTIFTDTDRPMHARFLGLYRDVLSVLHNVLLEELIKNPGDNADRAFEGLAEVERQISYAEEDPQAIRSREVESRGVEDTGEISAGIEGGVPSLKGSLGSARKEVRGAESESTSALIPKIIFPAIHAAFSKTLELMDVKRFAILIDEWSSIPSDLQPYFAELLNRTFFANPHVTIKIASLEFRSRFTLYDDKGQRLAGLELGGDIETAVDLDDFYVYDRDPRNTEAVFAHLLFKHLAASIENPNYLQDEYGVLGAQGFVQLLFTEPAFGELVRGAEGVARDLLQIFSRAYFNAWKGDAARITVPGVTRAAQEWYEKDKQANLNDVQHGLLRGLIEEVIGERHVRSFMVTREDSTSSMLRSLIDQRVVHIIRHGYADKDNPGLRYNIYTLDYGCYIDLKGTLREPGFELSSGEDGDEAEEPVVPFDDNRRIRRVVVPGEMLREPSG